MLKKSWSALALVVALAASSTAQAQKLSVAATPVPHAELLEVIKPGLAEQGITLDIKVFNDYILPNQQVADGALDANFFEHQPALDSYNKEHGTDMVSVGSVHIEPFGAYSIKIKDLNELKDGALVAVPNDPTNGARALLLLQKQGLLQLKDPTNILATARDVTENPKKLKFKELEAAMLPRALPDVDLALINTNYALEAGLNPTEDALFIEDSDSPYANLVVTRAEKKDDPAIARLVEALRSDTVRNFIQDRYQGAIVPTF